MPKALLTAKEATALLGIAPATLYAYVSRKQVRSELGPDGRQRLYHREDLDALRRRKGRAGDGAERALAFGMPVLPSALTTIADGRLWYRGKDAAVLAGSADIETVAALLWQAELPTGELPIIERSLLRDPLARAIAVLAAQTGVSAGTRAYRVGQALALWRAIAAALLDTAPSRDPIGAQVAACWNLDARGRRHIDAALVLLADHELNSSTFAVRVAAGTGATLSMALIAGLATLSGPRHGGESARVAALLAEAVASGDAAQVVGSRLARGERLPGFGHPLYPAGDPRAKVLLDQARELQATAESKQIDATAAAMLALTGVLPNVDFGLVALCARLGLPPTAPIVLFALGRTVGWLAHALEQQESEGLIRPRARYTGPPPALDQ